MRIALVCDWFLPRLGGIELHVRDLAIELRLAGHDVRVITTTPGEATSGPIPVHRLSGVRLPGEGVVIDPRVRAHIRRILASHQVDMVHCHGSVVSPTCVAGLGAAADVGAARMVTFHSMLHATAALIAAADAIVGWSRSVVISTVSSVVAAQLSARMPAADIAVLPNAIDVRFWSANGTPSETGPVHFVSAMRLSRKKRGVFMIQAFAKAHAFAGEGDSIRLTIAGEGQDRQLLERCARSLGIGDRVSFCGPLTRDGLRDLYARSTVFLLPSEREAFGLAALEALAAGLPVVAMLSSGARDFVVSGRNGLLARDRHGFTTALQRLSVDRQLSAGLRPSAAALLRFDWSVIAAEHERLYAVAFARRQRIASGE